jgi:hypothetical protein
MRAVALLLLTGLFAVAAPVPKQIEKPGVEVKLWADNQLVLNVTIQNHGKKPLELPYRVSPLELVTVTLQGEMGKTYTTPPFDEDDNIAGGSGTLTIPAGESKTLSVHTCHFLPELGEPGQKVTFTARLKHGAKVFDAKPLLVAK